jgi:hypothetical protein
MGVTAVDVFIQKERVKPVVTGLIVAVRWFEPPKTIAVPPLMPAV